MVNLNELTKKQKETPSGEVVLVVNTDKNFRLTRVHSQEGPTALFQGFLGIKKDISKKTGSLELNLEKVVELAIILAYDIPGQMIYGSYSVDKIKLDQDTILYVGPNEVIQFFTKREVTKPFLEYFYKYTNQYRKIK